MKLKTNIFLLGLMLVSNTILGQSLVDSIIPSKNIQTLNRIAEEYDYYKWVFGITAMVMAVWSVLGLRFFLKTKVDDWVSNEISKKAGLKIEDLKAALVEFAKTNDLKKRKILVVSAAVGQQANVKRIFDGCGFNYDEKSWVNIAKIHDLILGKVDILLLNDQVDLPLSEDQMESVMNKFKANVAYFYFGDKRLKSEDYRKKYNVELDFCNSSTRLEAGLLSLLKIR